LIDLKHSKNTVGKNIKNLKVFLNAASEIGINKNMIYKSLKFKKLTEETDKIYLEEEEILKLYRLDLSLNPQYEYICNLFIISCYTGLRYQDLTNIQKANFYSGKEGWFLNKRTQKTNEQVIVPLKTLIVKILEKYDFTLNHKISNQYSNRVLKELGFLAKIDTELIMNESIGGKLVAKSYKKFELISWHCARRSFATNSYKAGIPSRQIMKLTGHKTEQAFSKYIRITKFENAELLSSYKFFNNPTLLEK